MAGVDTEAEAGVDTATEEEEGGVDEDGVVDTDGEIIGEVGTAGQTTAQLIGTLPGRCLMTTLLPVCTSCLLAMLSPRCHSAPVPSLHKFSVHIIIHMACMDILTQLP